MGKRNNNFKYRYLILFVVLALFLISGCGKKEVPTTEYVTITFDSNGGSLIKSQQVEKGSDIIKPTDPIYEGYTFDGWYVDDKKWNFSTDKVSDNIILKAKWIENVQAYDVSYNIINNEVVITGLKNKNITELTILNEYAGYKTISIASNAFKNCASLTNITIPDSVKSIGDSAFFGCTSLASITIGNSVTSIGREAFTNCTSLVSITIPDSIISIGYSAFSDCTSLKKVNINSVESWCNISFKNFLSNPLVYAHKLYLNNELVTDLVIPNSVAKIGAYAFYDCNSLISITIGNSVTKIGEFSFINCTSLTSITIPNSVTSIGEFAFLNCYGLVEIINKSSLDIIAGSTSNGYIAYCVKQLINDKSDSKTSIDSNGFVTYNDGKDIWLVNYIGNNTEIAIPNNVTKINDYAFYNCSSLASVIIPNSVTSIAEFAFYNCHRLVEIINKSSLNITIGIGYITYYAKQVTKNELDSKLSTDSNGFVTYNDGKDTWLVNYIGNKTEIVIPNDVTRINDYAFINCSSLINITIPNSVTSIGDYAFCDCTSLTSIIIPDSVTSIGDAAFYNCISLTRVRISNNVTSIEDYTFYNCTSLTSIIIPDGVTNIGKLAFSECIYLTSIRIPGSVTSIGSSAFYNCTSLASIYYNKGTTSYTDMITLIEDSNASLIDVTWYYFTSDGYIKISSDVW